MPIPNYHPRQKNNRQSPFYIFDISGFIRQEWNFLKNDKIWLYTFGLVLLKSLIFLGIVMSDGTSWLYYFVPFYNGTLFILLSFNLIYFSIPFLFSGRSHTWVTFSMNVIFSFILIVDLMYYRGYGNFVSPYLFQQMSNLDNLASSIISMLRPYDILFIADLFLYSFIYKKYNSRLYVKRHLALFFILVTIPLGYIAYAHYLYDTVQQGAKRIVFRICWTPNETMSNLSPIGYHVYDSYVYWQDNKSYSLSSADEQEIEEWYNVNKENLPDNQYKGMFTGQNVLFLQVESLENFVLNQRIDGQEITPVLNRLLKNSYYFSNFHEQVWNGTTSDAELMANTSVYPVRRGSTFFRFPHNQYNSLPLLLKDRGYSTIAIHPDKGAYWNWRPALTSFGFEKTVDATYFNQDEKIGLGLSDGSYLNQVIPIITQERQPFYSFMITLSSHSPFDMPKKYRGLRLDPSLDDSRIGGYLQSIHYTDQQIGAFLDGLDQKGLLDNTVVVIYGDHEGVHKFYKDEVREYEPAQKWWLENNSKVPLLIYHKGLTGHRFDVIGGQIDILPTTSYLLGIDKEKYENTALGRNLFNTNRNYTVLGDRTFIGDKSREDDITHGIMGIDIADKLIQSNYFKDNHIP